MRFDTTLVGFACAWALSASCSSPDSSVLRNCTNDGGEALDSTSAGRVFLDQDNDGVFGDGDEALSGAIVFFEEQKCIRTNSQGLYVMPAQDTEGVVWVRGQLGWRPGPHWTKSAPGIDTRADIAIRTSEAMAPFSFVVASDTHAGIEAMSVEDQILGLSQAAALVVPPHFIAVTGDITQSNKPEQFDAIGAAIASIEVPYVPIPGNHDWYDGGAAYRDYFGPPSYSFDAGSFHFVVLNDASSLESRLGFLDVDLSLVEGPKQIVVMMHAPPRTDLRTALEDREIDYLLTGHMHSNRVLIHKNFTEFNTQPLVMGGIDLTPAGYRIFEESDSGDLRVRHRTTVNESIAQLVAPGLNQVFTPCEAKLIVSVQGETDTVSVTAEVESLGPINLSARGGWVFASDELALCDEGQYPVMVQVTYADGTTQDIEGEFVVAPEPALADIPNWSMFQGGAAHLGSSAWTGSFPGKVQWSNSVGGLIHGGSPIVHDGKVFVSVSDFGSGLAGGAVALDAKTGKTAWEHRVGFSVTHSPAAAGDKLLFVSNDGTLHCVDAATGEGRWLYEFSPDFPPVQRNLYSSPTIVGDVVFAGGRHEFAAFDIESGDLLWTVQPFEEFGDLGSHASPAVADNIVVVPFNRKGGLFAYDTELGSLLWSTPWEVTLGIQGSPVILDGTVYVVNELMQVTALDLMTGEVDWMRTAEGGTFGWGYLSSATPTVGDGQIFVASQRGDLIAMDLNTGAKTWTYASEDSLIRATHYYGQIPALAAAATSTPGMTWVAGVDGLVRALDSGDGSELWSFDLNLPTTSSIVLAGPLVIVATYDGTVRALIGSE